MSIVESPPLPPFRHEALLYAGADDLITRLVPFVREGVERGEPVMVALAGDKLEALDAALGGDAASVVMVDMGVVGHNPARIIPAWRAFLDEHSRPDAPARGVGEPIHDRRGPDELVECQLHEALLNIAFADEAGFQLVCPYDTEGLAPSVIHEACCSHPHVTPGELHPVGPAYRGLGSITAPFESPLPTPARRPEVIAFNGHSLGEVRERVARRAKEAGLGRMRASDLVLAVHELATNSVRHGGGSGVLRLWLHGGALMCEVRDRGHITDPLAGRREAPDVAMGGRGLWLVNALCDLMQIRSSAAGTTVRVHMAVAQSAG